MFSDSVLISYVFNLNFCIILSIGGFPIGPPSFIFPICSLLKIHSTYCMPLMMMMMMMMLFDNVRILMLAMMTMMMKERWTFPKRLLPSPHSRRVENGTKQEYADNGDDDDDVDNDSDEDDAHNADDELDSRNFNWVHSGFNLGL